MGASLQSGLAERGANGPGRKRTGLRATLMTTAAIGALAAGLNTLQAQVVLEPPYPPGTPPPQCTGVGGVFTCVGDLSAGLEAIGGPALNTLTVEKLTSIIAPDPDIDGINFTTTDGNNIDLTVDTGTLGTSTFGIVTKGDNRFSAHGIRVSNPGDGNITVNSTGNINAEATNMGRGIDVTLDGSGDVIVTSTGDITADEDAIQVAATADGIQANVTVTSVGNLTSGEGIEVSTRNGDVSVYSEGNITVDDEAIDVSVSVGAGSISIESHANITSGDDGIDASVEDGNVTIESTGTIMAGDEGINAFISDVGTGDIKITSVETITSARNDGINAAHFGSGSSSITVTGDIQAEADGFAGISAEAERDTVDATVIINSGSVITGGGGTGAGVQFRGGGTNRLENWGTIRSRSGRAVLGTTTFSNGDGVSGQDHVVNYATLDGTVDLGAKDDSLTLTSTSVITGVFASGGPDTDALLFGGTGMGTFGLGEIDTGTNTEKYRDFETFGVTSGTWLFSDTTSFAFSVDGGTLGGNATFGGLAINDGGTIAPGNSIGTIISTDDVAFNSGGIYQAEINTDGQSDLIATTGAASIDPAGATLYVILLDPNVVPASFSTYTVLTAQGGVTGEFASITDNLPDIDFTATYNPTTVQIDIQPASGGDVSQKEIYSSASMAAMDSALLFSDALRRRGGLQVSGQLDTPSASQGFGFLPTATSTAAMGSGTSSEASHDWSVWGTVLGSDTDVDADGSTSGWNATDAGLAFGLERRGELGTGTPFTAGLAGGYISTDVDSGATSAQIDSWYAGLYAAAKKGRLTLSGSASYAHHDCDYNRLITLGSGSVLANGEANGESLAGSVEAFFDLSQIAGNGTRFGPLATLDAAYVHRDAFTETGAGLLNQSVGSDNATQAVTGLGAAVSVNRNMGGTSMTFDARIAWQHVFGDRSIATASAIPIVNAGFLTPSAPIDSNRLAIGLGAAARFTDTISGHIRYDGAFGQNSTSHDGTAGLTVSF